MKKVLNKIALFTRFGQLIKKLNLDGLALRFHINPILFQVSIFLSTIILVSNIYAQDISNKEGLVQEAKTAIYQLESNFSLGDYFEINNPDELWQVVDISDEGLIWKNQDGIVIKTLSSMIIPPLIELYPNGRSVARELSEIKGDLNLKDTTFTEKSYGKITFTVVEKFNQQEDEWKFYWTCENRNLTKVATKVGIKEAAKIYCLRNGLDQIVFYYSLIDKIVIRIEKTNPDSGEIVSREITDWQITNQAQAKIENEIKITSHTFSQQISQPNDRVYNRYYSGEETLPSDSSDKIYDANKSLFKSRIITIEPFVDPISRTPREDDAEILRNKAQGNDLSGYNPTPQIQKVNPNQVYPESYYEGSGGNSDRVQTINPNLNLASPDGRQQSGVQSVKPRSDQLFYLSEQDPLFQNKYPDQLRNNKLIESQNLQPQQFYQQQPNQAVIPSTGSNPTRLPNIDKQSYDLGYQDGVRQSAEKVKVPVINENLQRSVLNPDDTYFLDKNINDEILQTNLAIDDDSDEPFNIKLPTRNYQDDGESFNLDANFLNERSYSYQENVEKTSMTKDPDFFQKHIEFIRNSTDEVRNSYLSQIDDNQESDLLALFEQLENVDNNLSSVNYSRKPATDDKFDPNSKNYFEDINQIYAFTGKSTNSSASLAKPNLLANQYQFENDKVGSVAAHLASYVIRDNLERGWMIYKNLYNGLLEGYQIYITEIEVNNKLFYRLYARANKTPNEVISLCRKIVSRNKYCMPRKV